MGDLILLDRLTEHVQNMFFLFPDFSVKHGFLWIKWTTLPLFIGQVTGAYEGIGCVSMNSKKCMGCIRFDNTSVG